MADDRPVSYPALSQSGGSNMANPGSDQVAVPSAYANAPPSGSVAPELLRRESSVASAMDALALEELEMDGTRFDPARGEPDDSASVVSDTSYMTYPDFNDLDDMEDPAADPVAAMSLSGLTITVQANFNAAPQPPATGGRHVSPYYQVVISDSTRQATWYINRQVSDFHYLHKELAKKGFEGMPHRPPAPSKQFMAGLRTFFGGQSQEKRHQEELVRRAQDLDEYLKALLPVVQRAELSDIQQFLHFIELSPHSFDERLGPSKGTPNAPTKEGFLYRHIHRKVLDLTSGWAQRWFVIRPGMICWYTSPFSPSISGMFMFDTTFQVSSKGIYGITLTNKHRVLQLKAASMHERNQWLYELNRALQAWKVPRPYESFSPSTAQNRARWFVDGKDTLEAIYDALQSAQREILVAGWWISPEVELARCVYEGGPTEHDCNHSLLNVLKEKAEQGVKVFVLVYAEFVALPLNSMRVKTILQGAHPNIKVLRHPGKDTVFWSHHDKIVVVDREKAFVGGIDLAFGRFDDSNHEVCDSEGAKWRGKDFINSQLAPMKEVHRPFEDIPGLDRTKHPRMPWHDIHMGVMGPAALDVARHFIQRWNHHKCDRMKPNLPFLIPQWTPRSADLGLVGDLGFDAKTSSHCQVLRSIGPWSCGSGVECSIQQAYIDLIRTSEHFIYIENQFFLSANAGHGIKNGIGRAILDRVFRAIREGRVWRCVVVMPLHPEGNMATGTQLRRIMRYQYQTINLGPRSIVQQIRAAFPQVNPFDYVSFYALRTWGRVAGENVAEQIYVHSKLMIVDDRAVIIGSANINDRSMNGDRDSEIAILTRDADTLTIKMNGAPFIVSRFAHELRVAIWKEHLGLDKDDYEPLPPPPPPPAPVARPPSQSYNPYAGGYFGSIGHSYGVNPYLQPVMAQLPQVQTGPLCACGWAFEPNAKFCRQCGKARPAPAATVSTNAKFCVQCGAKAIPNAKFCSSCGAAIPAVKSASVPTSTAPTPAKPAEPVRPPLPSVEDPVSSAVYTDLWMATARHNYVIYAKYFPELFPGDESHQHSRKKPQDTQYQVTDIRGHLVPFPSADELCVDEDHASLSVTIQDMVLPDSVCQ